MGIVEFLEARIAEDEADALPFRNDLGETKQWRSDEIGGAVRYVGPRPFGLPDLLVKFDIHAEAAHVARWDPARVLAECAAKRAIILDHAEMVKAIEYLSAALPGNLNQDPDAPWRTAPYRHLAAVYKDHPEYNQEWAL